MRRFWILRAVKIGVFAIAAIGALGFITMSLWNALVPTIFTFRPIGFWQALGLLLLSKLLFGGFRPYRGGGGRQEKRRLLERWEQMTPEEREKFKLGMRRGCGFGRERETTAMRAEA